MIKLSITNEETFKNHKIGLINDRIILELFYNRLYSFSFQAQQMISFRLR